MKKDSANPSCQKAFLDFQRLEETTTTWNAESSKPQTTERSIISYFQDTRIYLPA